MRFEATQTKLQLDLGPLYLPRTKKERYIAVHQYVHRMKSLFNDFKKLDGTEAYLAIKLCMKGDALDWFCHEFEQLELHELFLSLSGEKTMLLISKHLTTFLAPVEVQRKASAALKQLTQAKCGGIDAFNECFKEALAILSLDCRFTPDYWIKLYIAGLEPCTAAYMEKEMDVIRFQNGFLPIAYVMERASEYDDLFRERCSRFDTFDSKGIGSPQSADLYTK